MLPLQLISWLGLMSHIACWGRVINHFSYVAHWNMLISWRRTAINRQIFLLMLLFLLCWLFLWMFCCFPLLKRQHISVSCGSLTNSNAIHGQREIFRKPFSHDLCILKCWLLSRQAKWIISKWVRLFFEFLSEFFHPTKRHWNQLSYWAI